MFAEIEGDGPVRIQTEVELALGLYLLDRTELPVREVALAVGRGELDAITDGERAVLFSIERDTLESPGIVGDARPVRVPNGHVIVLGVHLHDARILAGRETVRVAALCVADDIADVVIRPLPIGPGDLLTGDEHAHVPLLAGHLAFGLARLVDHLIDLQP